MIINFTTGSADDLRKAMDRLSVAAKDNILVQSAQAMLAHMAILVDGSKCHPMRFSSFSTSCKAFSMSSFPCFPLNFPL